MEFSDILGLILAFIFLILISSKKKKRRPAGREQDISYGNYEESAQVEKEWEEWLESLGSIGETEKREEKVSHKKAQQVIRKEKEKLKHAPAAYAHKMSALRKKRKEIGEFSSELDDFKHVSEVEERKLESDYGKGYEKYLDAKGLLKKTDESTDAYAITERPITRALKIIDQCSSKKDLFVIKEIFSAPRSLELHTMLRIPKR